jgi:PadR family transcriptional regulator, regulatory protein PadR
MDRELKRGTLEMVLLQLLAERPMYGYGIAAEVETRTQGRLGMREGTLYPVLYRLEESGQVAPEWQAAGRGVPRKYYSITPAGGAALARLVGEWRTFTGAIDAVLQNGGGR